MKSSAAASSKAESEGCSAKILSQCADWSLKNNQHFVMYRFGASCIFPKLHHGWAKVLQLCSLALQFRCAPGCKHGLPHQAYHTNIWCLARAQQGWCQYRLMAYQMHKKIQHWANQLFVNAQILAMRIIKVKRKDCNAHNIIEKTPSKPCCQPAVDCKALAHPSRIWSKAKLRCIQHTVEA